MKNKIIIGVVILIVSIQFFRIDKSNPASDPKVDFFIVEEVPEDVQAIIKTSCFDCHSNNAVYPWYTNVAPVSWWVKQHINEGRDELNFSEWGTYSIKRKLHKLEEIEELIEEGEMPLNTYLWVHGEAKLTEQQQKKLINWTKEVRTGEQIEEL